MADLMTSNSTWASGTPDTATTLQDGVDQKRAQHINGPASAVVSLESVLGSASSLKGSYSDLATRLAVQIPASGTIIPPGTIWMYGGSAAPSGWLVCDGSSVSRSTYSDLFAVVSTTYGNGLGDGLTFTVPDFRGRLPLGVGVGSGGGSSGAAGTKPTGGSALTSRSRGAWGGEETHQLSTAEMPTHNHSISNAMPSSGVVFQGSGTGAGGTGTVTIGNAGSSQPHNNVQPFLVCNFIIKT